MTRARRCRLDRVAGGVEFWRSSRTRARSTPGDERPAVPETGSGTQRRPVDRRSPRPPAPPSPSRRPGSEGEHAGGRRRRSAVTGNVAAAGDAALVRDGACDHGVGRPRRGPRSSRGCGLPPPAYIAAPRRRQPVRRQRFIGGRRPRRAVGRVRRRDARDRRWTRTQARRPAARRSVPRGRLAPCVCAPTMPSCAAMASAPCTGHAARGRSGAALDAEKATTDARRGRHDAADRPVR